MHEPIQTIPVQVSPAYTVSIGPGLLAQCGERLAALFSPCQAAVIADSTVAALYLETVTASLRQSGFTVSTRICRYLW